MKKITISIFLLFICGIITAAIPEKEKQALIDIYTSTNGDQWYHSWDLNKNPSQWKGVTILNDHVLEINLTNNNLSGTLPKSISNLTALKVFNLHKNNITGIIPNSISYPKELKSLKLSLNNLYGQIPKEIVVMNNLEYLDLFFNNLSGKLPKDISNLTKLT